MAKRTKDQISYNMSRIKASGTTIEKILGRALWAVGLRYRKNCKKVFGKPDFVFARYKIAIFCDGAFWHGYKNMSTKIHNYKSRKRFWTEKIGKNIERDKKVSLLLKREDWKVLRFWDFQIIKETDECVKKVLYLIKK